MPCQNATAASCEVAFALFESRDLLPAQKIGGSNFSVPNRRDPFCDPMHCASKSVFAEANRANLIDTNRQS
jgi:hypothetical protein